MLGRVLSTPQYYKHIQGRAEREGVAGVTLPPTTHAHTHFFEIIGILTKCVGKVSRSKVVGELGVFYLKTEIQNSTNI